MDSVQPTASPVSLPRFLLGWLLSWILPAMLSTGLVGALDTLRIGDVSQWLFRFSFLSFPALWALGQAYVMRKSLRRTRLWGALTGGGMVAGAAAVVAIHMRFDHAWWPFRQGILASLLHGAGLTASTTVLVGVGASGVFFGLALGAIQARALGMSGVIRLQWTTISVAVGLLTAGWAYFAFELWERYQLRDALAAMMPLNGRWRFLPGAAVLAALVALCFALPTGLFMHWLLRRHERANAEAFVGRFE